MLAIHSARTRAYPLVVGRRVSMHAVHLLKTGASLEAAEEAARRAITLQPQDALAYVALGALADAPEGVRLLQVASRCALSPCTLSLCTLSRCKSLAPSSESHPAPCWPRCLSRIPIRWTVLTLRPLARQEASRLWPSDAAVTHQLAGRIMSHGAEHRLAPALLDAAALFTSLAGREGQAWAGLRDGPATDSSGMPAAYRTLTAMQPSWVGALPGVFNDAIEACDWSDRDALFHGLRRLACACA